MTTYLRDVTTRDQLLEYYRERGMATWCTEAKIKHLLDCVGINSSDDAARQSHLGDKFELALVEDFVLKGAWKSSNPPMHLREVTKLEDFDAYYREHGLTDVNDKIAHLKETMKVLKVCHNGPNTPETMLTCLEGDAVIGSWRAY